jgi:hypothetical protein
MLEGPGGELLDRPDWDWADRDGDDLIYAEAGGLWRQAIGPNGAPGARVLIHDFDAERYERREAPY